MTGGRRWTDLLQVIIGGCITVLLVVVINGQARIEQQQERVFNAAYDAGIFAEYRKQTDVRLAEQQAAIKTLEAWNTAVRSTLEGIKERTRDQAVKEQLRTLLEEAQ